MTEKKEYMREAISEAYEGIHAGHGGPFGTVIVKKGEIVGRGHNRVLLMHDPTRHGEMEAIRDACGKLKTHDLSDCELYTTGEPCPMCLGACLWANIPKVYYGCSILDNEKIGFRDAKFDALMGGRKELDSYLEELGREECLKLFADYHRMEHENY